MGLSGHLPPHPGLASWACDPGRAPVGTAPSLRLCPSHCNVVNDVESNILFCTGTHKVGGWSIPHLDATSPLSSKAPLRYSHLDQNSSIISTRAAGSVQWGRAQGNESAAFHGLSPYQEGRGLVPSSHWALLTFQDVRPLPSGSLIIFH